MKKVFLIWLVCSVTVATNATEHNVVSPDQSEPEPEPEPRGERTLQVLEDSDGGTELTLSEAFEPDQLDDSARRTTFLDADLHGSDSIVSSKRMYMRVASAVGSFGQLVDASRTATVVILAKGTDRGERWGLEDPTVHISSPQIAFVRLRQTSNGVTIRGGDVVLSYFSPSGELPMTSDTNISIPSDLSLINIKGVSWSDAELYMPPRQRANPSEIGVEFDPIALRYVKYHDVGGGVIEVVDADTSEVVETILPENASGYIKAKIRHLQPGNYSTRSFSTPSTDEWVYYSGYSGCTSVLSIENAVHEIDQVEVHSAYGDEQEIYSSSCPPSTQPQFLSCSGTNCLSSNDFREQTTYYWVKKTRDMAKSWAYSHLTPPNNTDINVKIDQTPTQCSAWGTACYSSLNSTIYVEKWQSPGGYWQYEPYTIAHEYGHHFGSSYTSWLGGECDFFGNDAGAIKEATATLVYLITLEKQRPFLDYVHSPSGWDGPHVSSVAPTLHGLGGCTNLYDFGEAFLQAWYEVINDVDCSLRTCSISGIFNGGNYNGSTTAGAVGWTSRDQALQQTMEAMAWSLQAYGFDSSMEDIARGMAFYLQIVEGKSSSFMSRLNSILTHHLL